MELTNEFRVAVPVERAWEVLTDVELIAPCMPGAQLQEIEGDEYRGIVKIKVGPITAQYKGAARFLEKDEAAHKVVLRAEGRETRGQGNANATITATMTPDGDGTEVSVVTDLTITGRVAQFGRGVLADVSGKLLGQFVDCLESKLLSDPASTPDQAPAPPRPTLRRPAAAAAAPSPATRHRVRGRRRHPQPGGRDPRDRDRHGQAARRRRPRRTPASTARPAPRSASWTPPKPSRWTCWTQPAPRWRSAWPPRSIALTVLWLLSIFIRRRRRNR